MTDDLMTDDLIALKAEVAVGWHVKIIDHDHLNDSRDNVTVSQVTGNGLLLRPKRPWSSQGRSYPVMNFAWEDGDQEVDGRRVRLYHTPAPHTGKSRRLLKTFVFSPPRDY